VRLSIPAVLSAIIAAASVVGLIVVASATDVGSAPGSGQQTFDAPGCKPNTYDGPSRTPHYLLGRNCPTPTPVIVRRLSRGGRARNVVLDGSRSFDPMGGKLIKFAWSIDGGAQRSGMRISVRNMRPGKHTIVLYVTGDSGLTGAETQVVDLR
jgi:hypothetical protein